MSVPVIQTEKANLELMSGKSMLHILKDVSLQVNSGEVTAVVGPSGSGKTSLLMILGGLERATSGKVVVGGQDISTANEDQLAIFRRQNLGILFQNFHLIPSMTALENVALALEIAETGLSYADIRKRAAEALTEVGLGDRTTHLPSALSGGEQQRVGLARAIVTSPKLMLADEPTGNLDRGSSDEVFALMRRLHGEIGTSFLVVTHDPRLAARCDRVIELVDGRIERDGPVVREA